MYIQQTNSSTSTYKHATMVDSVYKIDWTFFFFLTERCYSFFLLGGGWPQFYNSQSSPFPWLSLFSNLFFFYASLYIGGRPSTFTFVLVLLNKRKNEKIKRGKRTGTSGVIHSCERKKKRGPTGAEVKRSLTNKITWKYVKEDNRRALLIKHGCFPFLLLLTLVFLFI